MSDTVQIVALITPVIGTVIAGYIAYKMAQLKTQQDVAVQKVDAAAVEVKAVKDTLKVETQSQKQQLSDIAEVGNLTHKAVNSDKLIHARLAAAMSHRLAAMSGDKADIEAAKVAEEYLAICEAAQGAANAKVP